jgi:hypothetical protein
MSTIHQASFEAGLQTAVDLANAAASRLEADIENTAPRKRAATDAIRAFADGVQGMLNLEQPDPIGYTVSTIDSATRD